MFTVGKKESSGMKWVNRIVLEEMGMILFLR